MESMTVIPVNHDHVQQGLKILLGCLWQSDIATRVFHDDDLRLLQPQDHTALYRPKPAFIVIVVQDITDAGSILSKVRDYGILGPRGRVLFVLMNSRSPLEIFQLHLKEGDKFVCVQLASDQHYQMHLVAWNVTGHIRIISKFMNMVEALESVELYPKDISNLGGRELLITAQGSDPVINEDDSGDTGQAGGFVFEIVNTLASNMNFKYATISPPDQESGRELANKTWTGIVGQLARKEADIGVGAFSWTQHRERVIDFSEVFYRDFATFVIKKKDSRALFSTFSLKLWIALLPAIMIITATLTGLSWVEGHILSEIKCTCTLSKMFFRYLGLTYRMIVGQAGHSLPSSVAGHIALVTWWVVAKALTTNFSVSLTASFSHHDVTSPADSVQQLVFEDQIPVMVLKGTVFHTYLQRTHVGVYHQAWKENVQHNVQEHLSNLTETMASIFEKLGKGGCAYIGASKYLKRELQRRSLCEFHIAGENILPVWWSIGFQKYSPLQDSVSRRISWLKKCGLIEFWEKRHWSERDSPCREVPRRGNWKALSMEDLEMPVLILCLGYTLATYIMLAELIWSVSQCKVHH